MIGAVISLASLAYSVYANMEAADAAEERGEQQAAAVQEAAARNAEISLYDASVAEADALMMDLRTKLAYQQHQKMVDSLISTQKASFSKSGVAVGTGSALDVVAETAAEGARDSEMMRFNGMLARDRAKSLAERYRMLADAGLRDAAAQATLIQNAADFEAMAHQAGAIGAGFKFAEKGYGSLEGQDWSWMSGLTTPGPIHVGKGGTTAFGM